MEEVRTCVVCGARVTGRSDKKFCSDMCRHDWHNRQNRQERRSTERVNAVLEKNRRILRRILSSGLSQIPAEKLAYQQFNFNVFTHARTRILRPTLFYCYNICYYTSRKGIVHIRDTSLEYF